MRAVLLVLACIFSSAAIAAEKTPEVIWFPILKTADARYAANSDTVQVDRVTRSVQFVMGTNLTPSVTIENKTVKTLMENMIVMCSSKTVIAYDQEQYDEHEKLVRTVKTATVAQAIPNTLSQVIVSWACEGLFEPAKTVPGERKLII